MSEIQVIDARPGVVVMSALVGNCDEVFEIRFVDDGTYRYLVRGHDVPRQIYQDALELAQVDRYDPEKP